MSGDDPMLRPAADLDEIELEVAWLYTTAVCARHEAAPTAPRARRLVRQILAHAEALASIVERLAVAKLNADAAVDVGGVLSPRCTIGTSTWPKGSLTYWRRHRGRPMDPTGSESRSDWCRSHTDVGLSGGTNNGLSQPPRLKSSGLVRARSRAPAVLTLV
jgi:hypothetical protein